MRIFALAFMMIALAGCNEGNAPVSSEQTDNVSVPVSLLFTHDGCRVYRFVDARRYRYFANCPGASTITAEWTESCGKNCTRVESESTTTEYTP